jgi:hypothetical protein
MSERVHVGDGGWIAVGQSAEAGAMSNET